MPKNRYVLLVVLVPALLTGSTGHAGSFGSLMKKLTGRSARPARADLPREGVRKLVTVTPADAVSSVNGSRVQYDAKGRLSFMNGRAEYDTAGRLTFLNGRVLHDELGRVSHMNGAPVVYDARGRVARVNAAPVEYDAQDRVTRMNGAPVRYDADGRVSFLNGSPVRSNMKPVHEMSLEERNHWFLIFGAPVD